jgi:uncharacterized protein YndB with AHSA1/START domain
MSGTSIHHGTVVVERTIKVPTPRAYAAFADARERASWAAPSDTSVFIYDTTDFRVGGRDMARSGARDDPRFRVESHYIDIVPEQRIIRTETIHENAKLLATNITAIEFSPEGQATRLKITVQVTSLAGNGMKTPRLDTQVRSTTSRGIWNTRSHSSDSASRL